VKDDMPMDADPQLAAAKLVESAALAVFRRDVRVRSVGVTRVGGQVSFSATRSLSIPVPLALKQAPLSSMHGIPIVYRSIHAVPVPMSEPECEQCRPLGLGLEIENVDLNARLGTTASPTLGTLGGLVSLPGGGIGLISNNHVLAGCNRGEAGDRVVQPSRTDPEGSTIATLMRWLPLVASAQDAATTGDVTYNEVDLALAEVLAPARNAYLANRNLADPVDVATPVPESIVRKVGRTTGLTHGKISTYPTVLRQVPYPSVGECWFRSVIEIESTSGAFSGFGDSGSLIVDDADRAVGILFAGADQISYAFPLTTALDRLGCGWLGASA